VEEVRRRIDASDVFEHYRLVWSSTTDLDIIPAKAGKGNAIRYLLDYLELDPKRLVVAGDSGNDLSMFEACPRGIVVANAQPELMRLREEAADTLFFATAECAGGVTEGLRHFGVLTADRD
jgi:hydroxymethylpyrimidine pyrophosphatase-like HAD family hydrolase